MITDVGNIKDVPINNDMVIDVTKIVIEIYRTVTLLVTSKTIDLYIVIKL